MTRDDLIRFAGRDWTAIENSKSRYWAERKAGLSPAEVLQLGADMRLHALAVRPEWPTEAERTSDDATHRRVSEALRAVARRASH